MAQKRAMLAVLAGSSALGIALGLWWNSGRPRTTTTPKAGASTSDDSVLCGPQSLWTAALRLGQPVDWGRLLPAAGVTPEGTSLGGLKAAAEAVDLTATLRNFGWDDLRVFDGTAVLFVGQNHFVAVDPREPDPEATDSTPARIRVYDPDRPARWWTREELERSWNGAALVLSPRASSARSGLAWNTCFVDLGHLRSQEKAAYRFPYRNPTNRTIAVEVSGTSCGCTIPRLSATRLAPGEAGELVASVDVRNKRGRYTEKVQVTWTSPGEAPGRAELILAGGVLNNTVTSVEKIYFGEVLAGRVFRKTFFLHDPGDGSLEVRGTEIRRARSDEEIPGASATVRRVDRGSPLIGTEGRYPVREGDYSVDLTVPAGDDPNARVVEGLVVIQTSLKDDFSRLEVPFRAEVRPTVEAEPKALMVSGKSPGVQVVRVTLKSLDGQRPELAEAAVDPGAPIKFGAAESSGTAGLSVPVEFSANPTAGAVAEYVLRFTTKGGVSLKVPLIVVN